MIQTQPTFPSNIPNQAPVIQQHGLIQAVAHTNIQQQIDPQLQQQMLHNQSHNLPTHTTIQGQWVVPSYGTLPGQNIIQLQPIQHVHVIQSQATLQHMMPLQVQPPTQPQMQPQQQTVHEALDHSKVAEAHNLQLQLPEQKQTMVKMDSETISESTISR